jgi:CRP-like cAMP-binding protein
MNTNSIFDRLLLLPLFQGLSREELIKIIESVKVEFISEPSHSTILTQGQKANHLIFLLQGTLQIKHTEPCGIEFIETLQAPSVLFPECMFGPQPYVSHTIQATTEVQLLGITKHDLITRLIDFTTFRISILNYLCHIAHSKSITRYTKFTPEQNFIYFLERQFTNKNGYKEIVIKLQTLADILNISRLNTSKMLHQLEKEQVLELKRGKIIIPQFEKLTSKAHF